MSDSTEKPSDDPAPTVNPGYASGQIAKALATADSHPDPAVREQAREKVARWTSVLWQILKGDVKFGTRTPVPSAPAWATLEVITGGFATGKLLAGGALRAHELAWLRKLPATQPGGERRLLNGYFLSDEGLDALRRQLSSGRYVVEAPEEAALLAVAWLVDNGHAEEARALVAQLSSHFDRLRFYAVPADQPPPMGPRVQLRTVGETIGDLEAVKPNLRILAQKEAVEMWAPLYDSAISLVFESVADGVPGRRFQDDWFERAQTLLTRYAHLRMNHRLCRRPDDMKDHFAQVREYLRRCVAASGSPGEAGRIPLILKRYAAKRGEPGGERCRAQRARQSSEIAGPARHAMLPPVRARLSMLPRDAGAEQIAPLLQPISATEAASFGLPANAPIPENIARKLARCLRDTAAALVERGLITSGETLARVLPHVVAALRAADIADPALRRLYSSIYLAFRRRRSLLLLDLESQVKLEELPWLAALDHFRQRTTSSHDDARQALAEVAALTISAFPFAIVPNKLLQELRALAKDAGLSIPLVDELATDIFMGQFSRKFVLAAHEAARLLEGSLYETYYAINFGEVRNIPLPAAPAPRGKRSGPPPTSPEFARLCFARAGVRERTYKPASNGMVVEQQQILTTQNLAPLYAGLDLAPRLAGRLGNLAQHCFRWICARQQMKIDHHHARLTMLKNTAYAWRQMIFFLSLLPASDVCEFSGWANGHLDSQREDFRARFAPAMRGLALAASGRSFEDGADGARRFLGWCVETHWLMPPAATPRKSR